MSPQIIGLMTGVVTGLIAYALLSALAKRIEGNLRDTAKVRTADVLGLVGKLDVLAFALLGYVVGPTVLQ